MARRNLKKTLPALRNYTLINADGSTGLPEQAPFDRIYLTAGVGKYFTRGHFVDQLASQGILLYPEAYGDMYFVRKTPDGVSAHTMQGVGFVPLRGTKGGFD